MRVASKAGVGVILLLAGILALYFLLLSAKTSAAQMMNSTTEMNTTMETTAKSKCSEAEAVATFRASAGEDLITELFRVPSERFRVSFNSEDTGFAVVDITVNDEDGDTVDSFVTGGEEQQDSLILNQGPGNFQIKTIADTDNDYSVVVESCGGSGQDDKNNDDVIDNTIPKKPLPDTGGSIALIFGGSALLLLYGGLVAWRLKTRE